MWALVYFRDEGVLILSHPIRLEKIQDLSGRNGVEADLQGISVWLAICYPGNKWREAVFFPDDQVSFEFQNQKGGGVGGGVVSSFRNKEGKGNA